MKNAYHLSDSLKQLLTFMFQYQAGLRLSLSEIIAHPWVQDPDVPTPEEIKIYFEARRHRVEALTEQALQEEIVKMH
jgi:hypothetical protein